MNIYVMLGTSTILYSIVYVFWLGYSTTDTNSRHLKSWFTLVVCHWIPRTWSGQRKRTIGSSVGGSAALDGGK